MCSAETETKKCQDAEAKGLAIVDEAWVRARLSGAGGGAASASPSKATTSKKKGKQAASDEDEEDDVGADTEEDGGGAALAGLVFAITGTLSVPRAQFEKLITDNGGQVAKSVTNACTHLVSAETGTKKCQDAEEKGCAIVDEDWVRARVAMGGSVVGRSDMIPPQSFVPLPTFVNELIATDEDEGRLSYSNAKRNVGQLIYNRDDDEDAEDLWKVVSHKTKDGEDEYVIRSEKNPKETQELGIDELCDSWMTQPQPMCSIVGTDIKTSVLPKEFGCPRLTRSCSQISTAVWMPSLPPRPLIITLAPTALCATLSIRPCTR
jgi:hypothetical protein